MKQSFEGGANLLKNQFGSQRMGGDGQFSLRQPGTPGSGIYLGHSSALDVVLKQIDIASKHRLPTITIDDALFYAVDTRNATRLVPLYYAQQWSPSEDIRRQRDAERIRTLVGSTIGSGAYGLARLFGASEKAADHFLAAGVAANTLLLGGARLGAHVQRPQAPPQRVTPPSQQQPALRFGLPTASGQATRTNSTITREQLGTGSKPANSIKPPGWQEPIPGQRSDQERGHLHANVLGGTGKDFRNLVTIPKKINSAMWRFEKNIRDRVKEGEVIEYQVQPIYDKAGEPPSLISMTATGTRRKPKSLVILLIESKAKQP